MSGQLIAALIMLFLTIGITALFWWPIVKSHGRAGLVRFYWAGFWAFLVIITSLSGARAVLNIMGQDVDHFAVSILFGATISFIVFVVFAWGRLVVAGLTKVAKKNL